MISKFNGVSTKYLAQYLNWFVFLEKAKKSLAKALDFAGNVVSDISSIKTYRSITSRYENLLIPQLSKT